MLTIERKVSWLEGAAKRSKEEIEPLKKRKEKLEQELEQTEEYISEKSKTASHSMFQFFSRMVLTQKLGRLFVS